MSPRTILRGIGVAVALLLVLLLGIPAVAGWVPITIDDPSSGVPAGTLVVAQRVESAPHVEVGDVVTAELAGGTFMTRPVSGVTGDVLSLGPTSGTSVQVSTARVRSVEVYRLPVVGAVVGVVPVAYRTLVGRLLGLAFLAWAAVEIWDLARRSRRPEAADETVLSPAPRRLELTNSAHRIPGTDLVFVPGRPQPSRRARRQAESQDATPRVALLLDDLWRSVVGLFTSTIRRHPDAPARGRHRAPAGTDGHRAPRGRGRARGRSGSTAATAAGAAPAAPAAPTTASPTTGSLQQIQATIVPEFPPVRETRLGMTPRARAIGAGSGAGASAVWTPKADLAELEHAARVQDFEARRAAAEAALLVEAQRNGATAPADTLGATASTPDAPTPADGAPIGTDTAPAPAGETAVDRLVREQEEARRRLRDSRP